MKSQHIRVGSNDPLLSRPSPQSPQSPVADSITHVLSNDSVRRPDDYETAQTSLNAERDMGRESVIPQDTRLRKTFSGWSAVGLGFSITNSWVGYLSCFGQNLAYAGPQSVVFGLAVAIVIQWTITLGLSEIASAFPSSGGQYHFVYLLASTKTRNFAAFVVGWMNLLGWSVALCSGVAVTTQSINGLIALWNPDYIATGWQLYIIYVCTAGLSVVPLFFSGRWLPRILKASLGFSVAGIAVLFCLVLALRQQAQPLSFLSQSHLGTSGWSLGPAWALGVGNSMYAFSATDAVIHVAEEMQYPQRDIPRTMNLTLAIGFFTTFPLFVVLMLSAKDLDAVASAPLPYAELLYQITGSRPITCFLIVWIKVSAAVIGQWVTCGRLAWVLARDNGLPYSKFFGKISGRFNFPVRTTLMALLFSAIYGLLYLFNTTAFNSIITSAVLYLNITYAVPQCLLLRRGSRESLPSRPFNLGWLGWTCNILSPIFVLAIGVFVCFPPKLPATAQNMNYTSLALVTLFCIILVVWRRIGSRFEGPNINWSFQENVKAH